MAQVRMVARGPLTFRGQDLALGEVFEVAPVDAAILRYRGLASFAPRPTTPAPSATPEVAPVVVDATPVVPPIPDPPAPPPLADVDDHVKTRRHKRRDLEAEP